MLTSAYSSVFCLCLHFWPELFCERTRACAQHSKQNLRDLLLTFEEIMLGISRLGPAFISKWSTCRQFYRPATALSAGMPQFKTLSKDDSETIAQQLRPLVGEQSVSLAKAVRSQHGQDEGPDMGMTPDVVVFPESTEHVSEVGHLWFCVILSN
jgi:hypothetical protein